MDITPLFKACVKTVRTRNKTFGIQSPCSDEKQRILKTKQKNSFIVTAKDITSQITKFRDCLLDNREKYLSFFNNIDGESMSEAERDHIDTGAHRIMSTCSHLIKEFRNDNRKVSCSAQTREFMDNVTDLIDMYLKAVCKIHSEMKALRVKKALDIRKLSKLEIPKPSYVGVTETIKVKEVEEEEVLDSWIQRLLTYLFIFINNSHAYSSCTYNLKTRPRL